MKNIIYIMITVFTISCSTDDGSVVTTNNNIPSLVFPTNNLFCSSTTLDLQWTEVNTLTKYLLEVSKSENFSSLTHRVETDEIKHTISFERDETYFWRVVINKGLENEVLSSVFKFYTEGMGEENHLPYSPELIYPLDKQNIVAGVLNLSWSANDPDVNDVLSYEVYLGTEVENLINVSETDLQIKNINVNVLAGNIYYWRIDVKDNNGGETLGKTWSFNVN